jgi:hypothetical protein
MRDGRVRRPAAKAEIIEHALRHTDRAEPSVSRNTRARCRDAAQNHLAAPTILTLLHDRLCMVTVHGRDLDANPTPQVDFGVDEDLLGLLRRRPS